MAPALKQRSTGRRKREPNWVSCDDEAALKEFLSRRKRDIAQDKHGNIVFLAESAWALKLAQDNHPDVQFHFTSEFETAE